MPWLLRIEMLIVVLLVFVIITQLINKDKLQLKYSLIWIFMLIIMILGISFPNLIEKISKSLEFEYASNMIFSIAIVFLIFTNILLTVIVSSQSKKIKKLIQYVSINQKDKENI